MAAESNALVLISDKAVTRGLMVSDTSICKMSQLAGSSWFALISGDIAVADEILMVAESKLNTYDGSILSMMKLTSLAYQEVYDSKLEATVLRSKLLTKNDVFLRSRKYLPLPEKLTDEIQEDRKEFEKVWDSELLICGFDGNTNCHIFRIWKGQANNENRHSHAAVGIGADAALGRLMLVESDRADDLDKVLWDSFDAKVRAEIMQGVSYSWDAHIVLKSNPTKAESVPDNIHDLMDKVMNQLNDSPFDREPIKDDDKPDPDWKEQITAFTQTLIPPKVKPNEGSQT
jgi:hypothetical protein